MTLKDALRRFAMDRAISPPVPNYTGFNEWFYERLESLRPEAHDVLRPNRASVEVATLLDQLILEATLAGISITKDGPKLVDRQFASPARRRPGLARLNRMKLLLSLLRGLPPRLNELLVILAAHDSGTGGPAESQAAQRMAFFGAVNRSDHRSAFKILGRLREDDHDPGELSYLEALALFKADDLNGAIAEASRVPLEAVDGPAALRLVIEARAHLGDVNAVTTLLSTTPEDALPPFFALYAYQAAVANADDPEAALGTIAKQYSGIAAPPVSIRNVSGLEPIRLRGSDALR